MSYFSNPKKLLINKQTGKYVHTSKNLEKFQDYKTFYFDKSKTIWNICHMFDSYNIIVNVSEKNGSEFNLINPKISITDTNNISIDIGYSSEGKIDIFYFGEIYDLITPVAPSPSPTPTINPTGSLTPTPTASPTGTATPTPTSSITPSLTKSLTPTPTASPTPTSTQTPSVTSSISITPSITASVSQTPSVTPTLTPTQTQSISLSPSVTPTITLSNTNSASLTPINTTTPTLSVTPTPTPSSVSSDTYAANVTSFIAPVYAGSNTVNDSKGNVWTSFGSPTILAGQGYNSTDAIYFDGSSAIEVTTASSNFGYGTGDFTIELYANFTNLTNGPVLFDQRPPGSNGSYPEIGFDSSGNIGYYFNGNVMIISAAPVVVTGSFKHIALSRVGGTTRLFYDGQLVGSPFVDSSNIPDSNMTIGRNAFNDTIGLMTGYICDFRVTKGIGRYTTNFTPPSVPFPN